MESYQRLIDVIALENLQMRLEYWFLTSVLVWSSLGQIAATLAGLGIAYVASRPTIGWLRGYIKHRRMTETVRRGLAAAAISVAFPVLALLLLAATKAVAAALGWPNLLLTTCVNLLAAWIVIRLLSSLIRDEFWSRLIAVVAFGVATLNILGGLEPTILYLDEIGFRLGNVFVSALDMVKAVVQLAVLLWLAILLSRFLEHRMQRSARLTPSFRVLIGKLLRTVLVAFAFVVALRSAGVDLTALAVFTGAVGVGIGFGLQKPIANLISGFILLLDRSIKPGDGVELADTFGWVTALNARYVSITTRDGKEWLIPNEDLITQRVINWSFTHQRLRLLTPFGISFESDVRLAMKLAVEAASENPRVLAEPPPVCRLMGFGDSSVNLELRIWIQDPVNGVINVRSEILLAMWDKFRAAGIRIPFAQRDLHIKGDSELTVTVNEAHERAAV